MFIKIIICLLLYSSVAWAELSSPPVLQDVSIAQNQYYKDIYDNQNLPPTVRVNPNGNRYGNYGQIVRYYDGSSYTIYTCISSPNGKSWQAITDPSVHGVPVGGVASYALVKLDATDYNVGWVDINTLVTGYIQSIFSTFGGDGSAGDITISAATNFSAIDSPQYILQANNLTINVTKTLTINEGFAFIAVAGDCTIHGIINADGMGAAPGAVGYNGYNAIGNESQAYVAGHTEIGRMPCIGVGGAAGAGGTNGGGAGAEGGRTANNPGTATPAWKTTIIDWTAGPNNLLAILMASRGGGGGYGATIGGAGGGVIYIEVEGSLVFDGTLTSDGVAADTGGGGGGGTIIIRAKTITTNTGAVTVTGGASNFGGAGAAGYSKIIAI